MFSVNSINAEELSEWLDSDEDVMLVDVRTPEETARGIIPGARLLPLHLLPLNVDALKGASRLVIYCQSGARSAQACDYLGKLGLDQVYNLSGGIIGWASTGGEIAAPDENSSLVS